MKNKTEHKILFGPGGCLTREAVEAYIDDLLTDDELKKVKAHARKCQLCSDSLEGAGMFNSAMAYSSRVGQMSQSRFRRDLNREGRSRKLFYGITSAAASLALIFGIFYMLRYKSVFTEPQSLAEKSIVVEEEGAGLEKSEIINIIDDQVESEVKVIKEKNSSTRQNKKIVPVPVPKENVEIEEHVIELDDDEIDFKSVDTDIGLAPLELEEISEEAIIPVTATAASDHTDNLKATKYEGSADYLSKTSPKARQKSAKKSFYVAEVKPMFRGGDVDNFSKFVADSLKVILPDTILAQSIIVGFRIDTSGNVKNVKLISGTDSEILNKQIVKIIENSPQWIPASISGKLVNSDQEVQVVFGR